MDEMIEAIRVAVSDDATAEQRAAGAVACRTIQTALEAEAGKALALPGAPQPSPLAGLPPEQALDLLIARLSVIAEKKSTAPTPPAGPAKSPLRIAFVQPPARATSATRRKP